MKILRCTPDHFDVVYVINAHMKPGSADLSLARLQWQELGRIYEQIGVEQEIIAGQAGFPDMVFCANQSFPFIDPMGRPAVLLSKMNSQERRGEVAFFERWFAERAYQIHHLPDEILCFEGMGDALYSADRDCIYLGHGFRSDPRVASLLADKTGLPVHPLNLVHEAFYHLDTALIPLSKTQALVAPMAFDSDSYAFLKEQFADLIELTYEEAMNFAGNGHCPDSKHVILEQGSPRVEEELASRGFIPLPVNTSEFIKAGGSVFCLKLDLLS